MALLQKSALPALASNFFLPARRTFVCKAQKKEAEKEHVSASKASQFGGVAIAGLAASILLGTSAFPEDALAARSGGRAGGSSFRSAAPRSDLRAGPTIQNRSYNYNIAPAPPIYGGYGGGYGYGYGGGGITLFPTFVTPIGGGGGLFQLLFFAIAASTIIGVARSIFSKRRENDTWDD